MNASPPSTRPSLIEPCRSLKGSSHGERVGGTLRRLKIERGHLQLPAYLSEPQLILPSGHFPYFLEATHLRFSCGEGRGLGTGKLP